MEKIKIAHGRHVDLQNASSGQQSVMRILQEITLLISKNIFTFRTIEEPEVHLFPSAQNTLTELMVMCHNFSESEFLLTTHSPYFLATFNNLLYAKKAAEAEKIKVEQIGYPNFLQMNADHFAAYKIEHGKAIPIFEPNETLFVIDDLDAISLENGAKFEQLTGIIQENENVLA